MKASCKSTVLMGSMFFLSICFMFACATAPTKPEATTLGDYEQTKQCVSQLIKKEMKRNRVTGLSIALVDDQRIIWAEGFGFADKANKVPATQETVYKVGSISKLFTAMATMRLMEQGKIDIDKPLQTYLPEFSVRSRFPNQDPITLRCLMTHHSGLPYFLLKGATAKNPEPFTKVVTLIKDDYITYPPNFVFAYSNVGFTLLGHALERVSGRDFVSLTDELLLRPMSMTHSSFSPGPDLQPLVSKGYHKGKEKEEGPMRDIPRGRCIQTCWI